MKLFAVLLLLGMFSLSVAEVVKSFKKTCPQFFFKNNNKQVITPTVLSGEQYKQICQFYEGEYTFATLYDTKRRIPVYSAYTYTESPDQPFSKTRDYWKIEPQLDDKWADREMKQLKPEEEERLWNQAQNKDYTETRQNQTYTRGHVFPRSYAQSDPQKESTFTLTNAAPQIKEINTDWANKVEIPMLNKIKKNCDNNSLVYIVTGVVPDDNKWLKIHQNKITINEGLNIPRYFWSAFSCKSKTNNNINVSNAYIAKQITDPPTENLTVDELNKKLRILYNNKKFSDFINIIYMCT
uniref:Uncharacterized protein n=1 Tax=Astyanax mexicanus TaxID=7994 RepID=A0A8B9R558_ASTMX